MDNSKSVNKFTILDWIGIVFTINLIIILFAIPDASHAFNEMFFDFGGELPVLTLIVLKPWFSIILGIICVLIFSLQWHKSIKISLNRRRAIIVLSFIIAGATLGLCIVGLYLPIFKMAGSIE